MKSIAFFNNKGGVGKTTLVTNLAAFLALEAGRRVLLVDADPQCNATQATFSDDFLQKTYTSKNSFTISKIVQPLAAGKGYSAGLFPERSKRFGIDVLVGDPKLALSEDILARDWSTAISGDTRGLRTTLLFLELLKRCNEYDYVFFDVSPSLGAINRAVLLACNFFVSPMTVDIFSLKALENISSALEGWSKQLNRGLEENHDSEDLPIKNYNWRLKFAGYVSQQYIARRNSEGQLRSTSAYEKIATSIPGLVKEHFLANQNSVLAIDNYDLGSVPNLHSIVPMAQNARAPMFALTAKDGVVGAHFLKVREIKEVFQGIAVRLESNISHLVA